MGKWKTIGAASAIGAAAVGVRQAIASTNEDDIRGQVAVVTGGSSGLGLEMARMFADRGCNVVVCARDEEELDRARQDLAARGVDALAVPCDVGKEDEARSLITATLQRFGRIDILVCNAGVIQVGHVTSLTSDDFRRAMDIMYYGTLYPILAAIPHMRERGSGRIGLVTSIGGKVAVPYLMPYDAAKFASVGLGEGMRAELAPFGIKVTTIIPGLMRTGSYLNAQFAGEEKDRERMYRIFSSMSSLPLLTASGEDAARHFVRAIARGDAYTIYPPQYVLVAKFHDLAPATTAWMMAQVARLFPETGPGEEIRRGDTIDHRLERKGIWRLLTKLGRSAADEMQLRPGAGEPGGGERGAQPEGPSDR